MPVTVIDPGSLLVVDMFDVASVNDAHIGEEDTGFRIGNQIFAGKTRSDFIIRDDLTYSGDYAPQELMLNGTVLEARPSAVTRRAEKDAEARTGMAQARHRRVNDLREEKIAEGMTYPMPDDGQDVFVPLADQTYIANVQSLVTQATALAASGDTTTTINIGNATDDGEHDLTAAQMIAFGQAIMGHIQAFYAAARAHRKELTRIAQDTPALKDVSDALDAYDFTTGWPTEAT